MTMAIKMRKFRLLLLLLCLSFSLTFASNVFAEDDGLPSTLCQTLASVADVAGEWSPGVTICAKSHEDGGVTLLSLGINENYLANNKQNPNVSGISNNVDFQIYKGAQDGVKFITNGNAGTVRVQHRDICGFMCDEKTFKASDYSNPTYFLRDIMNHAKAMMYNESKFERTKYVPASGGVTIGSGTCVQQCPPDNDYIVENYGNAIKNKGYEVADCDWQYVDDLDEWGTSYYNLVCGGEPARTEKIEYTIRLMRENNEETEVAVNNAQDGGTSQSQNQSGGTTDDSEPTCMGTALNGQGWILCPTLENVAGTADGFAGIIDDMLTVDSNLYDGGLGAYTAWEIFRNFANIFMSIILIAIIFSQITGYGINNYGIKKMLPKFIVMAILINLSFVICQLAVDVSNILGSGLDNLFRNIAQQIYPRMFEPTFDSGNWFSNIVAGFIGAISGAGAIAGIAISIGAAAAGGGWVILALVLAALTALVSILLFFVMLGARMVIIITFIAIAPLAFACYILPNTQSLFKRWWDIFKAALVIFPICGALYGLSFVIKAIFLNTGDIGVWEGVALFITPFLPFLALPSLLKGALNGLGVVGNALTSVGSGIRRGLSEGRSAVQNSEGHKMQSQEGARRIQERTAQRGYNRLDRKRTRSGGLSEKDSRRMARYKGTTDRLAREDSDARAILKEQEFNDANITTLDGMMEKWEEAYVNGETDDLESISRVALSSFGPTAANKMAGIMSRHNLVDGSNNSDNSNIRASVDKLRDMSLHDSTFNSAMRSKGSDAFGMITSGGRDENGKSQNLSYFSANNNIATSASDWSTQSGSTIERGVKAYKDNGKGGFTPEMATQLLTSSDQNIQSGILSEEDKVEAILGALDEQQVSALADNPEVNSNVKRKIEDYYYKKFAGGSQSSSGSTGGGAINGNA